MTTKLFDFMLSSLIGIGVSALLCLLTTEIFPLLDLKIMLYGAIISVLFTSALYNLLKK